MMVSSSKGDPPPAKDPLNPLYVMMRRHEGIVQQKPEIADKHIAYEPYELALSFRKVPDALTFDQLPMGMILVLHATPVGSLYKGSSRSSCLITYTHIEVGRNSI